MPYSSVGELPPSVRGTLDEQGQKCWMKAFNKSLEKGDERFAWKAAWHFVAGKPDSRYMSGILSRDVVDDQHERLKQSTVVKEFNDLIWDYGASIHDTHSNRSIGVWFDGELEVGSDGVEQVRAYGMAYKGKPYYDEFWDNVQSKKIKHLSIGIMKIDPKYKCEDNQCWKQIDNLQVFEGSAVGRSSCPGTGIDTVNFSAKGYAEELAMGMEVELEHGTVNPETNITDDDPILTKKIAQAHIKEIPDYYTRLTEMEKKAMTEKSEGTETEQSPEAAETAMSNKDSLGLGDAGVEALQKLLAGQAEANKRLADLDSKLSSHILEEKQEKMTENPDGTPKEGAPPPGEAPKGEEKVGDTESQPEDKEKANKSAEEPPVKEEMSNKAVEPPFAPSNPASIDDIHPESMKEDVKPIDPETLRKQAEFAEIEALKGKQEMAEKEGATTPRPEGAAQDQGVKRVDSLSELLNDPAKLRSMSAMDIERFVDKYSKGEI